MYRVAAWVILAFNTVATASEISLAVEFESGVRYSLNYHELTWKKLTRDSFEILHTEIDILQPSSVHLKEFNSHLFGFCKNVPKITSSNNILYSDASVFSWGNKEASVIGLKNKKFSLLMRENTILGKHCPLEVTAFRISPDGLYIAFYGKEIESIKFINDKVSLWVADHTDNSIVYVYNLNTGLSHTSILEGEIADLLVDNDGVVYGRVSEESLSLSSPSKILGAISGHPVTKSEDSFFVINPDKVHIIKFPDQNVRNINWVLD